MLQEKEVILQKVKQILKTAAPDARILLYGSRARGDAQRDSDWDILVILDKQKIESSDYDLISYPIYELGWQEDVMFSVKLFTQTEWNKRSFTPFYKNVEKEGIVL
jgi:uncharacterized protein